MFIQNTKFTFPFTNFNLIFDFNPQNQLIALSFIIITTILNLYTISKKRKLECLIGSLYCLSSIVCVFAADFISMIISIEFMTIFTCIIIFCEQLKIQPLRQYFITHLFSSGLILIGMTLQITTISNTAFISLTESVNHFKLPSILILTGCLINAATIFVNGWVVNCYPAASSSGVVYLISFTTKVSLIIILKLFSGLEILKLFGISMMIYGLVLSLIEKNLKRLICYLTISQLGFILAAISINTPNIAYLITSFIFMHILYNGLFALYFTYIEDEYGIKNYQDLHKSSINLNLLIGFVISILIYISILPMRSSYIKNAIANILNEENIMLFFKIITCTVLFELLLESLHLLYRRASRICNTNIKPFSIIEYFLNNALKTRHDIITILYLHCCIITLFLCLLYPIQISHNTNSNQLIIITISLLLALIFRKIPRISTENINLDLYQYIEKLIFFIVDKYTEKYDKKNVEAHINLKAILDNILSKISAWHNQQTAIFIVLFLLISFILTLYYTST
ncbi:proton-conducting transporter transmembrane domain-containing protein [Rickettsia typhi]|uniref:HyfB domain containing protein n=2 Tax=Rickettsia typhi TaxID=785 RepID=Q68X89_RICTY|nr:proton-conducting transporter membrane subunit [Rickettsia typhi]AAU03753.1 HyfB domain containing protein [Rickettsia typhi str. Wilmington]AFE54130.1 putative monovalent cation/H+ antiporter subunit D [Rickettsia typhi str. TH1527]AFE54969.1 putative monovalent cation/H+ antiporter subunit D [Rickettsia typhi str. B9991CWPP]